MLHRGRCSARCNPGRHGFYRAALRAPSEKLHQSLALPLLHVHPAEHLSLASSPHLRFHHSRELFNRSNTGHQQDYRTCLHLLVPLNVAVGGEELKNHCRAIHEFSRVVSWEADHLDRIFPCPFFVHVACPNDPPSSRSCFVIFPLENAFLIRACQTAISGIFSVHLEMGMPPPMPSHYTPVFMSPQHSGSHSISDTNVLGDILHSVVHQSPRINSLKVSHCRPASSSLGVPFGEQIRNPQYGSARHLQGSSFLMITSQIPKPSLTLPEEGEHFNVTKAAAPRPVIPPRWFGTRRLTRVDHSYLVPARWMTFQDYQAHGQVGLVRFGLPHWMSPPIVPGVPQLIRVFNAI
uniref:Uncharacterized protein n=1 Tax=Knipowitschia caucasica TaxID=637954 RepID=A0AAV2J981_KNICA